MLFHKVREKQETFVDITGARNQSNVAGRCVAHQFINTSICLSSLSFPSPMTMSYSSGISHCWGTRSKALVHISVEKQGRRWDGGQVSWGIFCRNRGIYLLFFIYPFIRPSRHYEDAQYPILWSVIILWQSPENVVFYVGCPLEWRVLAFKMLVSIALTLKGGVRSSFAKKLQFWPVKALGALKKLTLVVPAVNHSVCPCFLALKGSSFRRVVQIQMNWEAVWNFIYDTHYILFTLCIQQEAENTKPLESKSINH